MPTLRPTPASNKPPRFGQNPPAKADVQKTAGKDFTGVTNTEMQDFQAAQRLVDALYRDVLYQKMEQLSKSQAKTITINTDERQSFRKKAADLLYGQGALRKERRIDIVTGPPASGKTSKLSAPLARQHGAILIDADLAKHQIPEYTLDIDEAGLSLPQNNGIGAGAVHQESNLIKDMVLDRALNNGDNIVLSFMGRYVDTLKTFMSDLKKNHGYTIHYHYVDIPLQTSVQRAVKRFHQEGRYFSPRQILKVGFEPKRSFETIKQDGFKEGYLDGYALYANDGHPDHPVQALESVEKPSS